MGIFDIIECKQHLQAIGEYLVYLDNDEHRDKEWFSCCRFIRDHMKKILEVLEKIE